MKLVVGLGNPGPKYETTRHNVGFLAVDRMIDEWRAMGPQNKYEGELYQATVKGEKVILIKPQTYMNLSGQCVGPIFKFYKCEPKDLIVIHDEVDLKPLAMKLKSGGGAAGHNGLKSVTQHVGNSNNDYWRIRLGVGKGKMLPTGARLDTGDHVLQQFSNDELRDLDDLLTRVTRATELLIQGEGREAMTQFNRKEN